MGSFFLEEFNYGSLDQLLFVKLSSSHANNVPRCADSCTFHSGKPVFHDALKVSSFFNLSRLVVKTGKGLVMLQEEKYRLHGLPTHSCE